MLFTYYHETYFGAHLGTYKTIQKIQSHFIWKGIDSDIPARVRMCKLCALSKPAQQSNLDFMVSDIASAPMEKIFVDLVGKLPCTSKGYSMILSCVDEFSKFAWLVPIRMANTESILRELSRIFTNFGLVKIIVSDNGSQFSSVAFKKFCFNRGINHVLQTPYYPKSSQAERSNRNLKAALIAFNVTSQNRWDETLACLPLALNLAKHESSKFTPFELMFKFRPNCPLSNVWRIQELLLKKSSGSIKGLWRRVRDNLRIAWQKRKDRYDKYRIPINFRTGDNVMY